MQDGVAGGISVLSYWGIVLVAVIVIAVVGGVIWAAISAHKSAQGMKHLAKRPWRDDN